MTKDVRSSPTELHENLYSSVLHPVLDRSQVEKEIWRVTVRNTSGPTLSVRVTARCADITPPVNPIPTFN